MSVDTESTSSHVCVVGGEGRGTRVGGRGGGGRTGAWGKGAGRGEGVFLAQRACL
jgi:hypothetical protein